MNTLDDNIAILEVHSKIILIGEHAVVYGYPAIALPFPLKVRCTIEKTNGPIIFDSSFYKGKVDDLPVKIKGLGLCIEKTIQHLSQPFEGLKISIDSSIPLGRGLGSSAATAVALVRAIFSFYKQNLSERELFSLVEVAETCAHGKPSGIDMAAVSSEGPIWFRKGEEKVYLKTGKPLYIVVGDTGRVGDTRTAVENVRKKYLLEPESVKRSLKSMERIADAAKDALQEGNLTLLGALMDSNQEELKTLGVSDFGLDSLIAAAKHAGALGAKLTGGGQGGCMIALAAGLEQAAVISKELKKAGAAKTWYFSTEENILYVSEE
ncbi:mevalonate kinase [Clostridium thermarum]|uniref:mevalonate kinase n=1 Tax=Clostridium thermarum TaxID=1716543 RepID=UPI0013D8ACB0|nr:mevalonate kinase [Clostridium thermarum]